MAQFLHRLESSGAGLARPVSLDASEAFVGNVVELDLGGGMARYEIVGVEQTPPVKSKVLNPSRRHTAQPPDRLVLRKVD